MKNKSLLKSSCAALALSFIGGVYDAKASTFLSIYQKNEIISVSGLNDAVISEHQAAYERESGGVSLFFSADKSDGRQGLFSKDARNLGDGGHLTIWVEKGRIRARLQSDRASSDLFGGQVLPNVMHHVAVSFGANGFRLYFDGEEVAADQDFTSGFSGNREPIVIGASQWASSAERADRLTHKYVGTIARVELFAQELTQEDAFVLSGLTNAVTSPSPEPQPNPEPAPTPGSDPVPTPAPAPTPDPDPAPGPQPGPDAAPTPNPDPQPDPDQNPAATPGAAFQPNIEAGQTANWSDPNVWPDGAPTSTANLVIGDNQTLIVDVSSIDVNSIKINGELRFEDQDTVVRSSWILVNGGQLTIGTEQAPLASQIEIIIDGQQESRLLNMMGDTVGLFEPVFERETITFYRRADRPEEGLFVRVGGNGRTVFVAVGSTPDIQDMGKRLPRGFEEVSTQAYNYYTGAGGFYARFFRKTDGAQMIVRLPNPSVFVEGMMNPGGRFIAVMAGGVIDMHGASARKVGWTQLEKDIEPGDVEISLVDPVNWRSGDEIAIAPSGYDAYQAEKATIASVSADGRTILIEKNIEGYAPRLITVKDNKGRDRQQKIYERVNSSNGFRYYHLGRMEFVAGESVDMRAEVGLLSRNIVIRSPDDVARWGVHMMAMRGTTVRMEGVEIERGGQTGLAGRYPFHWHKAGEGEGEYIRHSSIHRSLQRGIVVHGISNTLVADNVLYDILDHAIVFSEDGNEEGNKFIHNLGILSKRKSRDAGEFAFPVSGHHRSTQAEIRPSIFWGRNYNNVFIANHAAGAFEGNGFFFDIRESNRRLLKAAIKGKPNELIFVDNTAHSNFTTNRNPFYEPQTRGHGLFLTDFDFATDLDDPLVFDRFTTYKNTVSGVWMINRNHVLKDSIVSDSGIALFANDARVLNSAFIGQTSNAVDGEIPANLGKFDLGHGVQTTGGLKDGPQLDGVKFVDLPGYAFAMRRFSLPEFSSVLKATSQNVRLMNTRVFRNQDVNSDPRKVRRGNASLWDLDGTLLGERGVLTAESIGNGSYNEQMGMYVNLGETTPAVDPITSTRETFVNVSDYVELPDGLVDSGVK